jgi:hypothetical protein
MAKKTTKSATKSGSKAPAKKAPAKATKKKAPAKKQPEATEIVLDPAETKAIELAHSSEKVCTELEEAVTSAITQAVRKVFKQNGVALTSDQAEEVAMLLFGD